MSKNQTRDHITALFKSFAGQENALVIPRPYIDFCQGDILAALFLSQLLYWADRTSDPDGWIVKSYDQWHAEIGLTEYQIKRAIKGDKRRKNEAFSLQDVGVETELRKSDLHHGAATLHYRVNEDQLRTAVIAFMSDLNIVQDGASTLFGTSSEQCPERIYIETETTTETTSEKEPAPPTGDDTPKQEPEATPKPKPKRERPRNVGYDMMAGDYLGYTPGTAAFNAVGGRFEQHISWLNGNAITVTRKSQDTGKPKQHIIPPPARPVTAELLAGIRARYARKGELKFLPKETLLFVMAVEEEIARFTPAQDTPTLTPEELAAMRAEQFAPLPLKKVS